MALTQAEKSRRHRQRERERREKLDAAVRQLLEAYEEFRTERRGKEEQDKS